MGWYVEGLVDYTLCGDGGGKFGSGLGEGRRGRGYALVAGRGWRDARGGLGWGFRCESLEVGLGRLEGRE